MTSSREASTDTVARSWLIQIRLTPSSRTSVFISTRICAWIDTSSAVVGSSRDDSSGWLRKRDRDRHALAHAAGEFVRIGVEPALGVGNADLGQRRRAARWRISARVGLAMRAHRELHLRGDREDRIERAHRILEHHRDAAARASRAAAPCGMPISSWPSSLIEPPTMRPGGSIRPSIE